MVCWQRSSDRIDRWQSTNSQGGIAMSRTPIAALTLATVTLVASGCGGSSKSSSQVASSTQAATTTQTESTTSKASSGRTQLIAQANAICKSLNIKRNAVHISAVPDYARYLPQVAAWERTAADELERLQPSASLAKDLRKIVEANRLIAANTAKVGQLAAAGKMRATRPLVEATAPVQQQMITIARRDGFKDCANPA
jgi:hypothetical protein